MIKYLIMDVDGTLTDGKVYIAESGELIKAFNIKDGYGITHLFECGIEPIILTGRKSVIVENRAKELGVSKVVQGIKHKEDYILEMLDQGATRDEIAFIGDDLNDLQAMSLCGIVGCPSDAAKEVRGVADFVANARGGEGAVREFIDYLRELAK